MDCDTYCYEELQSHKRGNGWSPEANWDKEKRDEGKDNKGIRVIMRRVILFNDNYVSGEFGSKLDDILNSSERLNEKLVVINSNVSTKKGTEGNGNIDTGAQY